ncbi:PEP-CTERM sorting domain-containing protein [Polaromonas sp. C04]|uniref:PEP-CTERM sorting domain-containing protein n=1 Tax=Polaromonas sp. C04 TaxID=1945857 RepID=UPI001185A242
MRAPGDALPITLTLQATGSQTQNGDLWIETANGFIDPLYLDPEWTAEHPGYSIVTDGVGNAAPATPNAVPEPSTYALMLMGLGALARARRRHNL